MQNYEITFRLMLTSQMITVMVKSDTEPERIGASLVKFGENTIVLPGNIIEISSLEDN